MRPKYTVLLVVILFVLIILFQNREVVTLRLFFWSIEMSRVILVLITVGLGFILGFVTNAIVGRRRRKAE
jgi:uncharacterized integral membrane protein